MNTPDLWTSVPDLSGYLAHQHGRYPFALLSPEARARYTTPASILRAAIEVSDPTLVVGMPQKLYGWVSQAHRDLIRIRAFRRMAADRVQRGQADDLVREWARKSGWTMLRCGHRLDLWSVTEVRLEVGRNERPIRNACLSCVAHGADPYTVAPWHGAVNNHW